MRRGNFGVCGWRVLCDPAIGASGRQDRDRHAGFWAVLIGHLFPLPPGEGWGEGIKAPVKHLARTLRRQQTRAEQLLWSRLRNRQLEGGKFRRQQVVGPYIVNFLSVQPARSWGR